MDEALKLREQHEELRAKIIKTIGDYEKKFADIEMAVDFDYFEGEKIGHEPLEKLTTEMLIELVVSMGICYERLKHEKEEGN